MAATARLKIPSVAVQFLFLFLFLVPSARCQTGAGTALKFDGMNDFVSIGNSPALKRVSSDGHGLVPIV